MDAHSAKRVASAVLLLTSGCFLARPTRSDTGPPSQPVRVSEVIVQLSQNAEVREKLLQSLDTLPNAWGLIGDNERARLRDYILNRNWSGIDRFPGLTVSELRASVSVANAAASKYPALSSKLSPPYIEVGPFSAGSAGEVEWQAPAESRNVLAPPLKDLGFDLIMGRRAQSRALEMARAKRARRLLAKPAESQQLARPSSRPARPRR